MPGNRVDADAPNPLGHRKTFVPGYPSGAAVFGGKHAESVATDSQTIGVRTVESNIVKGAVSGNIRQISPGSTRVVRDPGSRALGDGGPGIRIVR